MAKAEHSRDYMEMLIKSALTTDKDDIANGGINDPSSGFCTWVSSKVKRFYKEDTMNGFCWDLEDFVQECIAKVCVQVKKDASFFQDPANHDGRLAVYFEKTAENLAIDMYRRRRPRNRSLDELIADDDDDLGLRNLPDNNDHPPDGLYELKDQIRRVNEIMPGFSEFLGNEERLVETLTAMMHYYGQEEQVTEVSRYWSVYKLLRAANWHSPPDLREHLKQTFPNEKSNSISQRITDLRKRLKQFLNGTELLDFD